MTHFGIVTPPVSGHLDPFGALGRELEARGHQVTLIHMADLEAKAAQERIRFCAIGAQDHPAGFLPRFKEHLAQLEGLPALRYTVKTICLTTEMLCREMPDAARRLKIEALLVDQTEPAGACIAEHLGIPFVTVCNALMLNREPAVPPPFTSWTYQSAGWARLRNHLGYFMWDRFMAPVLQTVQTYRRRWGLPPWRTLAESFSTRLQISQEPAALEYPRPTLPKNFYYVGPLRSPRSQPIAFPWDRLDGRPVIYASLGSLQGGKAQIFQCIVEACKGVDAQLVLSHGGSLPPPIVERLAQECLVVPYAPQTELLARAQLTICHAGLNTVLDSLSHDVPLVTIPITYEQPAIARRVQWAGVGRSVPLRRLSVPRLRRAIREVLKDPVYRQQASRIAHSIRVAGGAPRAAALIEQAVAQP
jgi:zeaxanthin glucosyltransferase